MKPYVLLIIILLPFIFGAFFAPNFAYAKPGDPCAVDDGCDAGEKCDLTENPTGTPCIRDEQCQITEGAQSICFPPNRCTDPMNCPLLHTCVTIDGICGSAGGSSASSGPTEKLEVIKPKLQVNLPSLTEFANVDVQEDEEGNRFAVFPWIGEYVKAAYLYAIGIVGLIVVIIFIHAGFEWMTSGGNSTSIGRAKKRMTDAVIGLAIVFGSYTILYAINPDLVKFKGLKVQIIKGIALQFAEEADIIEEAEYPDDIEKPTWNANTFNCDDVPDPMGVFPKDLTVTYTCPGLGGKKATTIPQMKDALCKAGMLAKEAGYIIYIASTYRPFDTQVKLWCKDTRPPEKRRAYRAVPGFSNHGHGKAVDIVLLKDGKSLTGNLSSAAQCGINSEYVKVLAEIFYAADPKFNRLETEIWHFEYGTEGQSRRGKHIELPKKCK